MPAVLIVQTLNDVTADVFDSNGTLLAPSLRSAVDYANLNAGADTITFAPSLAGQTIGVLSNDTLKPDDFAGPTGFVITDSLSIVGPSGRGITLDAMAGRRLMAVAKGVTLNLQNLTLYRGKAIGGDGGNGFNGGGGGAGLGGAIFATNATVNISNCTLTGNIALGGNGGDGQSSGSSGGGGSVGFAGGAGSPQSGGGGGAGTNGPGSAGVGSVGGAGGLNSLGQSAAANVQGTSGGGGGGGTSSSFVAHSGGSASGTNDAGLGGGGGGGAAVDRLAGAGRGGSGGFGAGGGGGGSNQGSGGKGGFGAGGGGASDGEAAGVGGYYAGNGGSVDGTDHGSGGGGGAGLGGAIFLNGGALNLTNCTLETNGALGGLAGQGPSPGQQGRGNGGAIFGNGGAVTVTNCTLFNNVSDGGQAVILTRPVTAPGASLTLRNSVVAGTATPNGPDVRVVGLKGAKPAAIRGSRNFIGRPGTLPRPLVIGRGDPGLAPLADNGGPTKTLLPQAGSRLIDAGRRLRKGLPATDQRGLPRVVGSRPDIGAVEVS